MNWSNELEFATCLYRFIHLMRMIETTTMKPYIHTPLQPSSRRRQRAKEDYTRSEMMYIRKAPKVFAMLPLSPAVASRERQEMRLVRPLTMDLVLLHVMPCRTLRDRPLRAIAVITIIGRRDPRPLRLWSISSNIVT